MEELSFAVLSQTHQDLREMVVQHQLAFLAGDIPLARERFLDLVDALDQHAQEEDERLLPLYRELAHPSSGGDWRNFTGEHEKIRLFLARLRNQIDNLAKTDDPSRAILEILDGEARLKELLEHHYKREEMFLFPELDHLMGDGEKKSLLKNNLTLKYP